MATSPLLDEPAYDVPRWSAPGVANANVIPMPGPAIGSEGLAGSQTFFRRYGKRAMDIILAVPILLLVSPIILLAAFAVLVTSGWPVFYGADRQGSGGRQLRVWKLRTMVRDADDIFARWKETEPALAGKIRGGVQARRRPAHYQAWPLFQKVQLGRAAAAMERDPWRHESGWSSPDHRG